MEGTDEGLEFLDIVDGVAVDGGDDGALEIANADLIGKGTGFDGFDEDSVEAGGSSLREILHGDAQFGGRDVAVGLAFVAFAFLAVGSVSWRR
jgi:hypothetical protein